MPLEASSGPIRGLIHDIDLNIHDIGAHCSTRHLQMNVMTDIGFSAQLN